MAANVPYLESPWMKWYLSGPSLALARMDRGAARTKDLFEIVQNACGIGELCCRTNGNEVSERKYKDLGNHFDIIGSGISATRFINAWSKLFSGQVFYETETTVVHIPAANSKDTTKSQPKGNKVAKMTMKRRPLLDIVFEISLCVARTLSPVMLLHKLKAYDLGTHGQRMGNVITGAYGIVVSINLYRSMRDAYKAHGEELTEKVAEAAIAVLDLLVYTFGLLQKYLKIGGFTITIVILSLQLIDAVGNLLTDVLYAKESYFLELHGMHN